MASRGRRECDDRAYPAYDDGVPHGWRAGPRRRKAVCRGSVGRLHLAALGREFLRGLRQVLHGVDRPPVGALRDRETGQPPLAREMRERGALVVAALREEAGELGEKTYTPALISKVDGAPR
ncbi:hypothetical protein SHKM778_90020 [Streptomyces sp. KM77-8]|uniref:Uncharacterized protein n=1 Tax=Streptomyces haneummycinicus TaxID=3074435 RepID=A0AAT9HYM0_9ACTN